MLHQQDGEPAGGQPVQHLHHAIGFRGPQPGHHLVEQQQLGTGRQRPCGFQHLAVGQGKAVDGEVGFRVQPDQLQHLQRRALGLRDAAGPAEGADHGVLRHRQIVHGTHDLEGAADAAAADFLGRQAADDLAAEADLARAGRDGPGDQAEAGGLAGAVRADECRDRMLAHGEGDVVHRGQPAEPPRDAAQLQQGRHQTARALSGARTRRRRTNRLRIAGQTPWGSAQITIISTSP